MKATHKFYQFLKVAYGLLIGMHLSGCSSLKPTDRELNSLPDNFTFSDYSDTTNFDVVSGSEFFSDPFLQSLIKEALDRNQELLIMEQQVARSKAEVKARKGEYLPSVQFLGSSESEKVGKFTRNGAVEEQLTIDHEEFPEPLNTHQVGLNASWELDVWKKLRNKKKAAYHEYLGSWEANRFMISQLVAEISSAYYDLITLDLISKNLEQYNNLQLSAIQTVRLLKQAGKSNELAVKRFEAEFDRNQSELLRVKQEIISLENEIRFLVGNPTQPIERSQGFVSLPLLLPTQSITPRLLLNRPDIKQAEQELFASKLNAKAARMAFFPSVELSANFGREAFKSTLLSSAPESVFYKIAADLVAPILNLNELKAGVQVANAKQEQAYLEFEKTSLKAYLLCSPPLPSARPCASDYTQS